MRAPLPILLLTATLAACAPLGGPAGRGEPPRREAGASPGGGMGLLDQYQGQLQDTAAALHLSPGQLVLWNAYQERIGALLADPLKLPPYRETRPSAPQQIAGKVDTVRNRLAAMEDIQEAAAKLYAALDEEQRKTADRLLPASVPALYSGLAGDGGEPRAGGSPGGERGGPGGGRGPGGMGGMGGKGGGYGRM